MLVASASTAIKIHELPHGNIVHNYQPGKKAGGPIRSISWSKDGMWLAVVPHTGQAEIISLKDQQLKLVHNVQDIAEPSCAAFQNNTKKYLALGTKNGQVLVYDMKGRSIKKRFTRAPGTITHVCFTAKDGHCVAACDNGDIIIYSCVTNGQSAVFRVPRSNSVTTIKTHVKKRQLLGAGSNEGVVAVWDINRGMNLFSVDAHAGPVTSIAFSPISAELIVTAGMDRNLKFFDFTDKTCITTVVTGNSLTAVDFYEDGKYFVTASQNGRVSFYDSRNVQTPCFEFEAHQSSIKHLAFQNLPDDSDNTSSLCSLNAENVNVQPRRSTAQDNTKRTSEFFGMFLQAPPECDVVDLPSSKTNTSVSLEGGDSFIVAMGLDKNDSHQSENFKEESRRPISRESRAFSVDRQATPSILKTSSEKFRPSDFKKISSTPKYLSAHMEGMSPPPPRLSTHPNAQISPVVAIGRPSGPAATLVSEEMRDVLKEIIREELNEVKQDMKFQTMHCAQQLRRMIIDHQMAMVREFIKLENYWNDIKDEINGNSSSSAESELLEENENLRRRIAHLESQISTMAVVQTTPQPSVGRNSQNESNST